MKKITSLLCALFTVWMVGLSAQAATAPLYAVLSERKLSLYRNNVLTASYRMFNQDLTVLTDSANDLLLCFYDVNNNYVGVSLGAQDTATLFGPINKLTVHSTLTRQVVLGGSCDINEMAVNAPVKVTNFGTINRLSVYSAAQIIAANGSTIRGASMYDPDSRLTRLNGSVVGQTSGSGGINNGNDWNPPNNSSSSNSSITFRTDTIDASYGDKLSDLRWELENNVRAYRNNKQIYGSFSWESGSSTTLRRSGTYRFRFNPDQSGIGSATGSIRIDIDDDYYDDDDDYYDDDLDFDITGFTIDTDKNQLRDYTSELKDNVVVYDDRDREVKGTLKWTSSSKRVTKTGWYEFTFNPSSSKYKTVREDIKITVEVP